MRCRLYINRAPADGAAELDAGQAHYLRNVLRLRPSARLWLFDGSGREWEAELRGIDKRGASCAVLAESRPDVEMPLAVHVVQAACRNEKIEHVLQKGTELGAASFTIVGSERAQLRLDARRLERRLERWRRIVVEAAEQSGRVRVPGVTWRERLRLLDAPAHGLALHPEAARDWRDVRADLPRRQVLTLAVGPEGGWSPADLDALDALGFARLAFGPRVMRTETAAPALLAAIQALL